MNHRRRRRNPILLGLALLALGFFALFVEAGPSNRTRAINDPAARKLAGVALIALGVWSLASASKRRRKGE